jgi:hypothetical protein
VFISLLYVTNAYRDHLLQTDINNFEAKRNELSSLTLPLLLTLRPDTLRPTWCCRGDDDVIQ